MRFTSTWMSTVALAAVMLTTGPALARGPHGAGMDGPGMGMGPEGGSMLRPEVIDAVGAELGLDAATLKKIKDLSFAANKEAIDVRAELERAHLDLRQMMDETNPDAKKVMKQVEIVGAAETKLRKNRVQLMLSVRELLTPEQRQKLRKILAERRHGPGPEAGPGFGPPQEH